MSNQERGPIDTWATPGLTEFSEMAKVMEQRRAAKPLPRDGRARYPGLILYMPRQLLPLRSDSETEAGLEFQSANGASETEAGLEFQSAIGRVEGHAKVQVRPHRVGD